MEPIFTTDQLKTLAASEGVNWDSMTEADQQFYRFLKEKQQRRKDEAQEAKNENKEPYRPLSPVLRTPKGEDFDLPWFDFQTKFMLHPHLDKGEASRRARAWKRKNRYAPPPKPSEILDLTQEEARDIFFYTDGNLYYKNPISRKTKRGSMVSPPHPTENKPRRVRVKYKEYPLAHLVFLYHHGFLPRRVKHLDDDKRNVDIDNLIEV
jgi:hypothetical protein